MVSLQEINQITSNRDRLVERWGQLPRHIDFYSDYLYERELKKTSSLIVLPYSRPHAKADWAKLIAVSHFRFQYSVIEEIAKVLAPAVVEMGVVPLVVPISEKSFNEMTWSTRIVSAITKHGALMYGTGHNA